MLNHLGAWHLHLFIVVMAIEKNGGLVYNINCQIVFYC